MTQLDKMLDNHEECRWTQSEIADWVSSLPEDKKNVFLDHLKRARRMGKDVHRTACQLREIAEQIDTQSKQPWYVAVSNATIGWTLGGIISGTKKLT